MKLQDQVRQLKNSNNGSDTGLSTYGYGHNYNAKYEMDSELDAVHDTIDDMWDELQSQMNNEVTRSDLKSVIRGIHQVLIKQLGKDNSRKWKKWEETAIHQTVYSRNLYDYFSDYQTERKGTKTMVQAQTTYSTQHTYRPKKVLKYKLIITEEMGTFIKKMMARNDNCEWGVAFSYTIDKELKHIILDKIYVMPVEQGGAHVKFVNESEFVIFKDLSELGEFVTDINQKGRFAGMMHSHHNMGSWHSSTDHGTIATYVNDFGSVLSLVWAWKGGKTPITCDVILKSKKDGFIINQENIEFENEISSNDKDIDHIDSELYDKYNNMLEIVKKDHAGYKKFLKIFEKTKKFLSIEKLYNAVNVEDNKCDNITTIKTLLSL